MLELNLKVGSTFINGNNYKDVIISAIVAIYDKYKHLSANERLEKYINYFYKNFSYDTNLRDRILSKSTKESREDKEYNLYRLFNENVGVCDQFAQAMSMISMVDEEQVITYCNCMVWLNGEKVAHAMNICLKDDKLFVIDISSMIHCKEGQYKQSKDKFCMVSLEDYVFNLDSEDVSIIPLAYSENTNKDTMMLSYTLPDTLDEYYDILVSTAEEINNKQSQIINANKNVKDADKKQLLLFYPLFQIDHIDEIEQMID